VIFGRGCRSASRWRGSVALRQRYEVEAWDGDVAAPRSFGRELGVRKPVVGSAPGVPASRERGRVCCGSSAWRLGGRTCCFRRCRNHLWLARYFRPSWEVCRESFLSQRVVTLIPPLLKSFTDANRPFSFHSPRIPGSGPHRPSLRDRHHWHH